MNRTGLRLGMAILLFGASAGLAQTVVVGVGQTLTEANIQSGNFNGQPFSLGPGTTFEVSGLIGPVNGSTSLGSTLPFSFQGSTVHLNSGGAFRILDFPPGTFPDDLNSVQNVTIIADANSTISERFDARSGTILQSAGTIGPTFEAFADSQVEISAGLVRTGFFARTGSSVELQGGFLEDQFVVETGSALTITGGEFRRNFTPVSDVSSGLAAGDVITATLSDGTVVIFETGEGDQIAAGTTTLNPTSLPAANPTPQVLTSGGSSILGIRSGENLTLSGTSAIGNNRAAVDATVTVDGGSIGTNFETAFTQINLLAGSIGDGFDVLRGSLLTADGGNIGQAFNVGSGGIAMIDGASIGNNAVVRAGGQLDLTTGSIGDGLTNQGVFHMLGGAVGDHFTNAAGAPLEISGGNIGAGFTAQANSVVTIHGAEFRSSLMPISQLTNGGITAGQVISGTLADGTVFILTSKNGDSVASQTTTLHQVAVPSANLTPRTISTGQESKGLRAGESLTVAGTASLADDSAAVSAVLTISGGFAGNGLEILDTDFLITSGSVGTGFRVYSDSFVDVQGGQIGNGFIVDGSNTQMQISDGTIGNDFYFDGDSFTMSGGTIGGNFRILSGVTALVEGGQIGDDFLTLSPMTITGGSFGREFQTTRTVDMFGGSLGSDSLLDGGTLNLFGGSVAPRMRVFSGATLNVHGGSLSDDITVATNAEMHLFVTDLYIDGILQNLVLGQETVITQRGGSLMHARLMDGSWLDLTLNSSDVSSGVFLAGSARLTATLVVPELSSPLLFASALVIASTFIVWQRSRQ